MLANFNSKVRDSIYIFPYKYIFVNLFQGQAHRYNIDIEFINVHLTIGDEGWEYKGYGIIRV